MAKDKKKKKVKKVKKEIIVDFDTSRLTSGLDFRKAQIELYEKADIEEIEDAMNYHGILLHADEVVTDYKTTLSVDVLEEQYHEKYKEALENLNKKKLVMDEDCIYFFITKVVEDNFDIDRLSDPEYIVDHLNRYHEQVNKVDYLAQIIKNVINIQHYTSQRNIHQLFYITGYDLEEMFVDIVRENVVNLNLTLTQVQELTALIRKMIATFEFDSPVHIYTDFVDLLARYGYENAKESFEWGKEQFPKKTINLYNALLAGLTKYYDQSKDEATLNIMKQLYKEAMMVECKGINDRDIYKLMQEHFGYLND